MIRKTIKTIGYPVLKLYSYARILTPSRGYVKYAGIKVNLEQRTFDSLVPGFRGHRNIPDYEFTTVKALKEFATTGSVVTVIGGGLGVTACIAANAVGKTGHVYCFEGNKNNIKNIQKAVEYADLSDRITLKQAIVSSDIGVYPGEKVQTIMDTSELPPCDILELDCEGAELEILTNLRFSPRIIIAESHGHYGSSSEKLIETLERKGYSVEDRGVAEPSLTKYCEDNDIKILLAYKNR